MTPTGMTYRLFERFGVELEYMIVDADTFDVRPVADELLRKVAGAYDDEVAVGDLNWSNELVTHVIELKTAEPAAALDGLADRFRGGVHHVNEILAPMGARLMPASVHPWMDPQTETRLWPHNFNAVYESFHRIFGCRGHGWSNLQASHINLPFGDDDEFGRLHAAVRLVLPILPALAASSPILDGQATGLADARLEAYRHNCRKVPSLAGRVIPEPVFTRREYDEQILSRLYRDIAPYDPEGILQDEWLNARGAIARFDRGTIEIRLLDMQECPEADLAVLMLIVAVLRALVEERWCGFASQRAWSIDRLEPILLDAIRDGGRAIIRDAGYLDAFGVHARSLTAAELWHGLFGRLFTAPEREHPALAPLPTILGEGCLSERILKAVGDDIGRPRLVEVCRRLCQCLSEGRMFLV